MKKFLNFAINTQKGQKISSTVFYTTCISMVIGLILSAPVFWMGNEYEGTWMNSIAPYFFYPFITFAAFFLLFFTPYLWYIVTEECTGKCTGDTRAIMKGMAIFLSIVPGGFFYSFVAKALVIPTGVHNIVGMLIFGLFYLLIVKTILRKPFSVAQTFIPLC